MSIDLESTALHAQLEEKDEQIARLEAEIKSLKRAHYAEVLEYKYAVDSAREGRAAPGTPPYSRTR